jgi:hypothetical protein
MCHAADGLLSSRPSARATGDVFSRTGTPGGVSCYCNSLRVFDLTQLLGIMKEPNVDAQLSELQSSVQRKLGRCVLRLQEYEALLKHMLPRASYSGQPEMLPALLTEASDFVASKTMGALVGMLTETYLRPSALGTINRCDDNVSTAGSICVSSRTQLVFDAEGYEVIKAGLKQLVDLRNMLVHHFLAKFDIGGVQGCLAADAFLDSSFETIDAHFTSLRGWAKTMVDAQKFMGSVLSSPIFQDLLFDGISPDGKVHWGVSGIVQGLRDAEAELASDGWTLLNSAIAWMRCHAPEQNPKRYGCSSWRQVLHESKKFDVFKQAPTAEPHSQQLPGIKVWYRSRRLPVDE